MIWPQKPHSPGLISPLELTTFRLTLRPPQLPDQDQWRRVREKNKDFLQPLEPKWTEDALTEDFFRRRYNRQKRDWETDRAYSFLIFRRNEEDLIGGINLNHICRGAAQHASLGYWLDESLQGQGYMAEAARAVIQYGFQSLHLVRINAFCLSENERSASLLLRLGFEEEGFAKNYLQINGRWRDHRLFGLVSEKIRHPDNYRAE